MIAETYTETAGLNLVTASSPPAPAAAVQGSPAEAEKVVGPPQFRKILVAVDVSEQANLAVDAAARLAKQLKAELFLVNVFRADVGFTPEFIFAEPHIRTGAINRASFLLEEAKKRAAPVWPPTGSFLREGDAATEILDLAVRLNVDLIVIGTHGRGRLAQAVLGSVANSVARQAACPVMMVGHQLP